MKKLLIIEDDIIIKENSAEILKLAGFNIFTAENGKDGSLLAKEEKPDLIICDIMMPVLDGYGVLHILSKDPETAAIPFLFLSAKTEISDIRKGMDLGADDYLCKPFDDTALLNAVEVRLKKHSLLKKDSELSKDKTNYFLDSSHASFNDFKKLTEKKTSSCYKKKEIIFHAEDGPHYLYFLQDGEVKTYKTHADGKEYITNIYRRGEFFGLAALFTNKTYSDSAVVLKKSDIIKVPKDEFYDFLSNDKKMSTHLIQLLSDYIQDQELQRVSLAYDSVRKRTAEALLLLYKRYISNENSTPTIIISREDLAGIAGTATETVIRCLGEFKEDNLIVVDGREIIITNPEGLRQV